MARDYNDVGRYADEDRCCREHDLCPNSLSPGECKRGLCNNAKFTRSHCDCDARFRRCLQGLNTGTNNQYDVFFYLFSIRDYLFRYHAIVIWPSRSAGCCTLYNVSAVPFRLTCFFNVFVRIWADWLRTRAHLNANLKWKTSSHDKFSMCECFVVWRSSLANFHHTHDHLCLRFIQIDKTNTDMWKCD